MFISIPDWPLTCNMAGYRLNRNNRSICIRRTWLDSYVQWRRYKLRQLYKMVSQRQFNSNSWSFFRKGVAYTFTLTMVIVVYPTILCIQALTFSEYFLQACRFNLTSSVTVKWANIAVALLIICKLGILVGCKRGLLSFFQKCQLSIFLKRLPDNYKQSKTPSKTAILVVIVILNMWMHSTFFLRFIIVLTAAKLGLLLAAVVLACIKGRNIHKNFTNSHISGNISNLSRPFDNSTLNPDDIVSSFYNSWFAFDGYDIISVALEEIIEPET